MNPIKFNYKFAPFSDVHTKVYISIILGQIACGYALGISGPALTTAASVMPISNSWMGIIGAGSLLGLAGSALIGRLGDRIGRARLLMVNMYIFTLLSLLQLTTTNLALLLVLRILIGLMMAVDYTVGNALLVEWLPTGEDSKRQSRLLTYWTLGFIIANIVGSMMDTSPQLWQWTLASSAVVGGVTAIFRTLVKLPASPAWLASQGKMRAAEATIKLNLGFKWTLPKKMKKREKEVGEVSWFDLFSKQYRRKTLVGSIFYMCQSFTFFGISTFLPLLITGMGIKNPDVSTYLYDAAMLSGVLIGTFFFNKVPRRFFLISGFVIAAVALITLVLLPNIAVPLKLTIFVIFAVGLSAHLVLDYTYTSELFDVKIRATGVGTCITASRFGAAAGTFLLPVLANLGGASLTMTVCAVPMVLGALVCFFFAPETHVLTRTSK
ncbi:MAG: MFS transporter [Ligilactobacillus sp.]|nr:MFS transporter [Ligilactobacillus sp.]